MSLNGLNSLLKWSIGTMDQPSSNDEKKPLSEADMNFIKGALNSVHEHETRLNNAVEVINNYKSNDKEALMGAFQLLEEHFDEHPSNSSNIVRSGLLQSFINILNTKDLDLLNAVLSVISTATSNNESIMEPVGESDLVPTLLSLKDSVLGTKLEPKLLSALSSSIRNSTTGESKFLTLGGLDYMCQCIRAENIKTRERALLLLNHFLALKKLSNTTVYNIKPFNLVKSLIPLEPDKHGIQYCEICTRIIKLIATKYRSSLRKGELGLLKVMLKEELTSISSDDNESYNEITSILKELTI